MLCNELSELLLPQLFLLTELFFTPSAFTVLAEDIEASFFLFFLFKFSSSIKFTLAGEEATVDPTGFKGI